jgi:hypothetical protein
MHGCLPFEGLHKKKAIWRGASVGLPKLRCIRQTVGLPDNLDKYGFDVLFIHRVFRASFFSA